MNLNDIVLLKKESKKPRIGWVVDRELCGPITVRFELNKPETEEQFFQDQLIVINPRSFWLVHFECRTNIIAISPKLEVKAVNNETHILGFFAPGQDVFYYLYSVQKWIKKIKE